MKYKNITLNQYLKVLSSKAPVPGGGSAAALSGALGVALLAMVAHFSLGKGQPKKVEQKIRVLIKKLKKIQDRLMDMVDLDAEIYLKVVKAKTGSEKKKAMKAARKVPKEVCRLCYGAVQLSPYLVEKGNKNLVSDVEVAVEMLLGAFNAAIILIKI